MKTKILNKYWFMLSIICIIISFFVMITYSFLFGKTYLKVNDKNRDIIIDMLNESDYYTDLTNEKIVCISNMQSLGEWVLYVKYENGSEKEAVFDDGELKDLYKYIDVNGQFGGFLGTLTEIILYISIIYIIIYITYTICHFIIKK